MDIKDAIRKNGEYDVDATKNCSDFDLRNPKNNAVRFELMKTFGLNPILDYDANCKLTNTIRMKELLKNL